MRVMPIVVVHDSNGDADNALSWSLDTRIKNSYHTIIRRTGEIVYLIPSWAKATACGPSSYRALDGSEVSINGSVDPFSYSVCLEGPMPYTDEEYYSLSYLISQMGIAKEQVVVHSDVLLPDALDRDPCVIDMGRLWKQVAKWTPVKEIYFGIGGQ